MISEVKVPKLPSAQEIGTYDGKVPAERYFRRLGHTLKHVNGGEQVDPSTHISMFELALEGDAAKFAETSSQIQSIMSRVSQGAASNTDFGDLQQAFSVKFPPAVAEKKVGIGADVDVRQAEGEHLTDYYNRVLNLYQRAGGQDTPSAEPHQKKRKGMPIGELLSDDERGLAPLMREKIVNKNAKVLSQIWGRAGLGPIDWNGRLWQNGSPIRYRF